MKLHDNDDAGAGIIRPRNAQGFTLIQQKEAVLRSLSIEQYEDLKMKANRIARDSISNSNININNASTSSSGNDQIALHQFAKQQAELYQAKIIKDSIKHQTKRNARLLAVQKPATSNVTDDQKMNIALRAQIRELEGKIDDIKKDLSIDNITKAFQSVFQDQLQQQLSQQSSQNVIMPSQAAMSNYSQASDQVMLSQQIQLLQMMTRQNTNPPRDGDDSTGSEIKSFSNVMDNLNGMVEKFNAMMKVIKPGSITLPIEPEKQLLQLKSETKL